MNGFKILGFLISILVGFSAFYGSKVFIRRYDGRIVRSRLRESGIKFVAGIGTAIIIIGLMFTSLEAVTDFICERLARYGSVSLVLVTIVMIFAITTYAIFGTLYGVATLSGHIKLRLLKRQN